MVNQTKTTEAKTATWIHNELYYKDMNPKSLWVPLCEFERLQAQLKESKAETEKWKHWWNEQAVKIEGALETLNQFETASKREGFLIPEILKQVRLQLTGEPQK